jgi:hypothetical protein
MQPVDRVVMAMLHNNQHLNKVVTDKRQPRRHSKLRKVLTSLKVVVMVKLHSKRQHLNKLHHSLLVAGGMLHSKRLLKHHNNELLNRQLRNVRQRLKPLSPNLSKHQILMISTMIFHSRLRVI